jgi:superfamily II DNA/RNA helicase
MVLFATDIAARGLDFAKLDWVLQMDCPEDVAAYIHRVGRTARYVSGTSQHATSDYRYVRSASQGKNLTSSPGDISSRVGSTTPSPPRFLQSQKCGFTDLRKGEGSVRSVRMQRNHLTAGIRVGT